MELLSQVLQYKVQTAENAGKVRRWEELESRLVDMAKQTNVDSEPCSGCRV